MSTTIRAGFRIRAIPAAVAAQVRGSLTDEFGNALSIREAESPVPCRSCLRLTAPGERVIVFAYRPFETSGPYAETGPIFIHADHCEPYDVSDTFPLDFRQRALTMRAYNDAGTIEGAEVSTPGKPEASLERLFADEGVRFVHVRNPAWGCFDFQVDRRA